MSNTEIKARLKNLAGQLCGISIDINTRNEKIINVNKSSLNNIAALLYKMAAVIGDNGKEIEALTNENILLIAQLNYAAARAQKLEKQVNDYKSGRKEKQAESMKLYHERKKAERAANPKPLETDEERAERIKERNRKAAQRYQAKKKARLALSCGDL